VVSGTVISDISDHFVTFVLLSAEISKNKEDLKESRNFCSENLQEFKLNLQQMTWDSVLQSREVNDSYNKFWGDFKQIFDLYFPCSKTKFNKNLHTKKQIYVSGIACFPDDKA
jgi:hypothetical protein